MNYEAIGLAAGLVIVAYVCQAIIRNDNATSKINRARVEITTILTKYDCTLHEVDGYDQSPCEVEFTLIKGAGRGLPSRVMLRYLRRLKAGKIAIGVIKDACIKVKAKHDNQIKKRNTL